MIYTSPLKDKNLNIKYFYAFQPSQPLNFSTPQLLPISNRQNQGWSKSALFGWISVSSRCIFVLCKGNNKNLKHGRKPETA
jgi:hypothetical protein